MKHISILVFIFLSIAHVSFGQTPKISIGNNNFTYSSCVGSVYKLPVSIEGNFNSDNKFSVQVRPYYSQTLLTTIPAVLRNGYLELTFTDASLYTNPRVQLRVVATSPAVESEWTYQDVRVNTKGSVAISSSSTSDTVNVYDNISLKLKGNSTSQVTVTLSDSTKFQPYYYESTFEIFQPYIVSKSGTITIAHAENGCGAMETSGKVKPVVNSTSLQTVSVTPNILCENGEVKIFFSTLGPALSAQTKYKIRFIQADASIPAKAEVPAQLVGNYLVAKFPKTFVISSQQRFLAQIVTENPALVGNMNEVRFVVAPAPGITFTSQSKTVDIAVRSTDLQVNLSGLPPFEVELNDGTRQSFDYSGNAYFFVAVRKNASYSIKSFTSGCGKAEINNPQTVDITITPGIRIADQTVPPICAGTKGRIKFETSAELTSATTFLIKGYTTDGNVLNMPAVRSGEYLEFDTPANAKVGYNQQYQIVTTNPSLQSQFSEAFRIHSPPMLTFDPGMRYSYDVPGTAYISYSLTGGGPYTIQSSLGKNVVDYPYSGESFFLKETTEFKIKSVANNCYRTDLPQTAIISLTRQDSPYLRIESMSQAICSTDSLEITFSSLGKFDPQNTFAIQTYVDCCNFATVKTTSEGGKYKIKVPVSQYSTYAQVRVASTNPVVFSDIMSFNIHRPIDAVTISSGEGTEENPRIIYSNRENYLNGYFNNNSYVSQIKYTENQVEKTIDFSSPSTSFNFPINPPPGVNTTYTLKEATNNCGTKPLNISNVVRMQTYRLEITSTDYYGTANYCLGAPISVPFGPRDGTPAANVTYSLQIRKQDSKDLNTLKSGETGRIFNTTIPDNLAPGNYAIRVISSDGALSEYRNIQISAKPTATLSNENGSNIVNVGNGLSLKITYTGTPPFTSVFENGSRQTSSSVTDARYVNPQKGGEFSIKSVTNYCGYGTTSGSVTLTVKPQLSISSDSYSICESGTFNVSYRIDGDADLADDYIRFELLDIVKNTFTVLDSTKVLAGTKQLRIPDNLKGAQYQIRCTVRKYSLNSSLYTTIATKPEATISGGTIINKGETARLVLKTNKNSNDRVLYELSDGTKGEFYGLSTYYPNYISVNPQQTTTYTIKSLSNSCGEGTKSGSARVEVNPVSERTISTTSWTGKYGQGVCTGDTIIVQYTTMGNFSAGNSMQVQISDSTGFNFQNIVTIGSASPLKAVVPVNLVSNRSYRIRVTASDANTASGANNVPLTASQKSKARFASSSVIYDPSKNPKIVILFEGGAPWTYTYGSDIGYPTTRTTVNPKEEIELYQASPNQYYKLFNVSNSCGPGTIGDPSRVLVEVVTGLEPTPQLNVLVSPNPAQDVLRIDFSEVGKKNIQLFDVSGKQLINTTSFTIHEELDIRQLPIGMHILRIESAGKVQSFKVIKQ